MAYDMTGLRSPEYYQELANQPMEQAQYQLTSPQSQERARQLRSDLAGKGVLSGLGYDTMQGNWAGDILSQARSSGQNLASQARLADLQWGRELPFKEAELTGQYNKASTLAGKRFSLEETTQDLANLWNPEIWKGQVASQNLQNQWYPSQFTGKTPTGESTWNRYQWENLSPYQKTALQNEQDKIAADKQLADLQKYLNVWNLIGGEQTPLEAGGNLWGGLGQTWNDFVKTQQPQG